MDKLRQYIGEDSDSLPTKAKTYFQDLRKYADKNDYPEDLFQYKTKPICSILHQTEIYKGIRKNLPRFLKIHESNNFNRNLSCREFLKSHIKTELNILSANNLEDFLENLFLREYQVEEKDRLKVCRMILSLLFLKPNEDISSVISLILKFQENH